MVAAGILLISLGVPCFVLGIVFRKDPPQQKGKGKSKPSKGKSQKQKKQPEPKRAKKGGGSLIWGGLGFALIGVVFLVMGLMK